jgi:5-formyltetrahydrofolate cyclo-ligase
LIDSHHSRGREWWPFFLCDLQSVMFCASPVAMTIDAIKLDARKAAGKSRARVHTELSHSAPLALASHAFPIAASVDALSVSGFFPYKSEIDTRPLLGRLAGEGWTTALPIVIANGEPLIFRRWYPGQPTVPGMWDIPQPTQDEPLIEPDVLLVPMLAFDRKGYRLGYGGGFYDRTLAKLRTKKSVTAIGVAYAGQEVDSVPRDAHDQPLDFIMTEKEVISCA